MSGIKVDRCWTHDSSTCYQHQTHMSTNFSNSKTLRKTYFSKIGKILTMSTRMSLKFSVMQGKFLFFWFYIQQWDVGNLAPFCVSTDLHSDCLISDTCVRPYKNLHLPFWSPFGRLAMQKIKNGGCLISRLPKTIYVFNTSEPTTHKPTKPCYIFWRQWVYCGWTFDWHMTASCSFAVVPKLEGSDYWLSYPKIVLVVCKRNKRVNKPWVFNSRFTNLKALKKMWMVRNILARIMLQRFPAILAESRRSFLKIGWMEWNDLISKATHA